jgi:hypothetical protein
VKRAGRGAGNWGAIGEETLEATETALDKAVEAEAATAENETPQAEAEPAAAASTTSQPEATKENKKEEEDKTRTLKEYREAEEKDLARIELPQPRGSNDDWSHFQPLRREPDFKLSIVAPPKETKKARESNKENKQAEATATTPTTKTKTSRTKVPVEQVLTIKPEPRQDRRPPRENEPRQERRAARGDKIIDLTHKSQQDNAPSSPATPINLSKENFPALASAKN